MPLDPLHARLHVVWQTLITYRLFIPNVTNLTFLFFFLTIRHPPRSTLFPYTPLFRSGDVAWVRDGYPPQTNIVRVNGQRATLLTVQKNGNASTLSIISGIKALLPFFCTVRRVARSEEHTSELQSHSDIVCRLLLAKKK